MSKKNPSGNRLSKRLSDMLNRPIAPSMPTNMPHMPWSISNRGHSIQSSYDLRRQQINQDLLDGIVPEETTELYRFLPPDHPATQQFSEKMGSITQRLLGDKYDSGRHNFRFLISENDSPNALILSTAKPPIISVTTGYLKAATSEDMLAAILAHELGHNELHNRIEKRQGSTKLEEAGADAWGAIRMQKAGYSPYAMIEMLDTFEDEKDTETRGILTHRNPLLSLEIHVRDPHPPVPVRKRNVETAIAMMEQSSPVHMGRTSLELPFLNDGTDIHYISYIENWLEEQNYHALSFEQKLSFLKRHIPEFIDWDSDLDGARIDDFNKTILALKNGIEGHDDQMDAFIEHFLTYSCNDSQKLTLRKFYYSACEAKGVDKYSPTPNLSRLHEATKHFVEAKDKASAIAAAEKIEAIASQYTFSSGTLIRELNWPNFRSPEFRTIKSALLYSGDQIAMPWNQHVKWAIEEGEGSEAILAALNRLNVPDSRLPSRPWNYDGAFTKVYFFDYQYSDLTFDENGYVTACRGVVTEKKAKPKGRFSEQTEWAMRSNERERLQALDERAEALLPDVDWRRLENDFAGFVREYKEFLEPQLSVVGGGTKFQEVFVAELKKLYEQQPTRYAPIIKTFFSEFSENKRSRRRPIGMFQPNRDSSEAVTVPDMTREYKDQYQVYGGNIVNYFRGEDGKSAIVGLDMRHPYMRFVLEERPELFPNETKIDYLRYNRKLDVNLFGSDITNTMPFDWRKTFNYDAPETSDELIQALQSLEDFNASLDRLQKAKRRSFGSFGAEMDIKNSVVGIDDRLGLTALPFIETYLFISKPDAPYLDFRQLPSNQLTFSPAKLLGLKDNYKAAICKQVERNARTELNKSFPLTELIDVYNHYRKGGYFGSNRVDFLENMPALQQQYETKIIERLRLSSNSKKQVRLTEGLLFKNNIKNPESRNQLIDIWVKAKAETLGKDDGSSAYRNNFKDMVKAVEKSARMGQGINMITQLLNAVEAQQNVAFDTREYLIDKALEKGMDSHLLAAGNDFLLERLGQNPKSRKDVLEFLTTPLTEESAKHILESTKHQGNIFHTMDNNMSEEAQLSAVGTIHKNFWSLPFPARTVYLERVLFPIDGNEAQFNEAVQYVMDSALPDGKAYAEEARLVLKTYMEEISVPLQRLTLSALITASEKNVEQGGDLRAGQVLAMVLGKSGPAGGKILQAVHSYLQSMDTDNPDLIALREDLKSSKTEYDAPLRWEIFERIQDTMPDDSRHGISRVNHLLGAGSYAYTVEIERDNDEKTALTLLRPNAAREAEYQFSRFGKVAETLAGQDKRWEVLPAILEDGKQRASVEGDFTATADQIHYQESLRQNMRIRINGHDYRIGTAPLIASGREFKETRMAHGVHFNDLAPKGPTEHIRRKELAQAKWTAGIYDLLRGGAFDQDQHGGNVRVSGRIIAEFDHGAIPYDIEHHQIIEPTQQGKKIIGQLLGQAINVAASEAVGIDEYLVDVMRDTRKFGNSAQYLERVKQHVLALNDYMQHMGETPTERNAAVQESIAAILKTGNVDKTIMEAAYSAIDNKAIANMKSDALASSLEIKEQNISAARRATVKFAGTAEKWRSRFNSKTEDVPTPKTNWADTSSQRGDQRGLDGQR